MVLGAGALAWWLTSDDGGVTRSHSAAQVAVAAAPREPVIEAAAPAADPAQVRRAYEQFQVTYADLGVDGLEAFSRSCAQALARDPRIIDYCVAFDAFSRAVASGAGWFDDADARHVELAQAALPPGVDAATRIAEIRRLTRSASGLAEPVQIAEAAPVPVPVPTPAPASAPPPAAPVAPPPKALAAPQPVRTAAAPKAAVTPAPARVQKAAVRPAPKRPAVRRAANRCAGEPTAAARAICENAELRAADRRLKQAYERALAAGVNPLELDRQQAEWRTAQNANAAGRDAMARAYELRIGEIEAQTRTGE